MIVRSGRPRTGRIATSGWRTAPSTSAGSSVTPSRAATIACTATQSSVESPMSGSKPA